MGGQVTSALDMAGRTVGGLALFLFGMQMVRDALEEGAVARLRVVLQVLARRGVLAVVAGVVITVVLSSSATAGVLLVSLVDAGVLGLRQALGVMLGSAIGTTLTVQLFAFRLEEWSLVILAVGFLVRLLARYSRTRQVGSILLGLGLIFFGVTLLSQGVRPLVGAVGVDRLERLATVRWIGPVLVLLLATALTAVLMNSAAVVVLAFALVEAGLSLEAALPIVFGANVGTCASQLLAGALGGRSGRQLALGHLLFKVIGVLLFLPFLGPFASLVERATEWTAFGGPGRAALGGGASRRAVANAHTMFNLANTLIFLPTLGWLVAVVRRVLPEATAPPAGTLEHIDYRFLDQPETALERAHQEVMRMGRITLDTFRVLGAAVEADDTRLLDDVERRDDLIDLLDEILTDYLARLPDEQLEAEALSFKHKLLYIIKDFEHIGDFVSKEMVMLARKKSARGMQFAVGEQAELRQLGQQVQESFVWVLDFLAGRDPSTADAVLARERRLDIDQRELYYRHLERLGRGVTASRQSSSIFIDLVGLLRAIHRYLADVVRVLEWREHAGPATPLPPDLRQTEE